MEKHAGKKCRICGHKIGSQECCGIPCSRSLNSALNKAGIKDVEQRVEVSRMILEKKASKTKSKTKTKSNHEVVPVTEKFSLKELLTCHNDMD